MFIHRRRPGKIVINGNDLVCEMDGMTRVATEIVRRLDSKFVPGQAEVIVKDKCSLASILDLKNIKVIERRSPSRKWEFINIDLYCMLTNAMEIRFRNSAGCVKGIYYLHDLIPLTFYGNKPVHGRKDIVGAAGNGYYRNLMRMIRNAEKIVTVSEYSKQEIIRYLGVEENKVAVVAGGWDHFKDIKPDNRIFERYPELKEGQYFFSLGSISPHKNFRLIYEFAKRDRDSAFVIAGRMNRGLPVDVSDAENLILMGGLSDGEIKALMKKCKAFIFPSLVEGMGIPPLEALSCGVPVCVSDIPVLHEFCGGSVHYFNPNDREIDLESLITEKVDAPEFALNRVSWNKAAADLYSLIMQSRS